MQREGEEEECHLVQAAGCIAGAGRTKYKKPETFVEVQMLVVVT